MPLMDGVHRRLANKNTCTSRYLQAVKGQDEGGAFVHTWLHRDNLPDTPKPYLRVLTQPRLCEHLIHFSIRKLTGNLENGSSGATSSFPLEKPIPAKSIGNKIIEPRRQRPARTGIAGETRVHWVLPSRVMHDAVLGVLLLLEASAGGP